MVRRSKNKTLINIAIAYMLLLLSLSILEIALNADILPDHASWYSWTNYTQTLTSYAFLACIGFFLLLVSLIESIRLLPIPKGVSTNRLTGETTVYHEELNNEYGQQMHILCSLLTTRTDKVWYATLQHHLEIWYTIVFATLAALIAMIWILFFVKLFTEQANGNLIAHIGLATALCIILSFIVRALVFRRK